VWSVNNKKKEVSGAGVNRLVGYKIGRTRSGAKRSVGHKKDHEWERMRGAESVLAGIVIYKSKDG
jgi:hypothetical protein